MRKGKTIRKTIDCLIAAVAMENDLALLHHYLRQGQIYTV